MTRTQSGRPFQCLDWMRYDDWAMPNRRHAPGWLVRSPATATMLNFALERRHLGIRLSVERSPL